MTGQGNKKGITRRGALQMMGAGVVAAGFSTLPLGALAARAKAVESLKKAAAAKGLLFGSHLPSSAINAAVPAHRELFLRHCALFAPVLTWNSIVNASGHYDLSGKQAAIDFYSSHGLKLTGQHLIWHGSMPAWYWKIKDRSVAEKALRAHIAAMGEMFGPHTYSWNPVNQGLGWDSDTSGLRNSPLLEMFGRDYFTLAFNAAKEAAPQALRLYNDFGLETTDSTSAEKRKGLLSLLDWMLKNKLPIDGVGLAAHIEIEAFAFDEKVYRDFLKEIASRGLKIFISELDVIDYKASADIAKHDKKVADVYSRLLNVALDEPAVKAVVSWGLSDRYTWIAQYDIPFPRKEGVPNRPLPFDADFKPKPAYYAILKALKHAPVRGV